MLKKLIAESKLKDTALRLAGLTGHLPKYFIAGVGRSGTTTLYNYMIQHPDISESRQKENQFWDSNFKKGLKWYKGYYPKDNCIDATPSYYRHPKALKRILDEYGFQDKPKMIVILREPMARLESVINFAKSRNDSINWHDQTDAGNYHKYLQPMLKMFDTHVMFLENLTRHPEYELSLLFGFLDLEGFRINPIGIKNPGKYVTKLEPYQTMKAERVYEKSNMELTKLLGVNLPW